MSANCPFTRTVASTPVVKIEKKKMEQPLKKAVEKVAEPKKEVEKKVKKEVKQEVKKEVKKGSGCQATFGCSLAASWPQSGFRLDRPFLPFLSAAIVAFSTT